MKSLNSSVLATGESLRALFSFNLSLSVYSALKKVSPAMSNTAAGLELDVFTVDTGDVQTIFDG
jgi:hypothetical protein